MPTAQQKKSIYEPDQEGLHFPREPVFHTLAEERQHRRERLAAVCRIFGRYKFEYGFAGHVTVRDPEHHDLFWTNPFGMSFSRVRASDLILVDHAGKVVEGTWAVNRAGFVLHSAIHEAHPDIVASCHAHTVNGMAWAALGRPLDPITQTACGFYGHQAVITEEAGAVVVEKGAGNSVANAFGNAKVAIHQNLRAIQRRASQHRRGRLVVHCAGTRLRNPAEGGGGRLAAETGRAGKGRPFRQAPCDALHGVATLPAHLRLDHPDRSGSGELSLTHRSDRPRGRRNHV